MGVSKNMHKALINMQNFETQNKLQDALILFIIKNFASWDEEHKYRRSFMNLDLKHKGYLTRKDLIQGYGRVYTHEKKESISSIVNTIMKRIDYDMSGKIEYSEWVLSTIDKDAILSERYLKKAFKYFD